MLVAHFPMAAFEVENHPTVDLLKPAFAATRDGLCRRSSCGETDEQEDRGDSFEWVHGDLGAETGLEH